MNDQYHINANESLVRFVSEVNKKNHFQKGNTNHYRRIEIEQNFGYFIVGYDIDVLGEWQDSFRKYYFKIREFIQFMESLKNDGIAEITSEVILYQQCSQHDFYYHENDFRHESVQKGVIKARFEVFNENLEFYDKEFEPTGEQKIWNESNVGMMHIYEVENFVIQTFCG